MDKNGDSLELQTSSSDILDKTIPEPDAQKQKYKEKSTNKAKRKDYSPNHQDITNNK